MHFKKNTGVWLLGVLVACAANSVSAEDPKATTVELANGQITLLAPEEWVKGQPKSNIVQYEFSAPKLEEKDKAKAARITFTASGGTIEANITRWFDQFEQPDKSATKDKAKLEKFDADGQTVHWVDIPGTFKDTMGAGPFAPSKAPTMRENYRMLGAIIETKKMGNHYVKITGPTETVEKLAEGFKKMLKELKVKS
jgi:hypothetical protein